MGRILLKGCFDCLFKAFVQNLWSNCFGCPFPGFQLSAGILLAVRRVLGCAELTGFLSNGQDPFERLLQLFILFRNLCVQIVPIVFSSFQLSAGILLALHRVLHCVKLAGFMSKAGPF